jgi:hypothetical protein
MKGSITRRNFMRASAAGMMGLPSLGASGLRPVFELEKEANASIPKRKLGKTGVSVSQLAFGGGSRFVQYKTDAEAIEVLNWVIDHGVNYLDTAHGYGDGLSETRYGMVMKDRRKEIFLVTKIAAREPEAFQREFELSLKRLQTDHVDLLHIHGLGKMDDVDKIGQGGGVYEVLSRLKAHGATRYIGFTSHTDGAAAKNLIERFDFDCCMMQLNPSKAGNFEDLALPAALKKNMGVVAMKATAQEKILGNGPGKANIDELLRYALSLPVAAVNIGMPSFEMVKHNVEVAKAFKPMTPAEKLDLLKRMASTKASLEAYFGYHSDIHVA